MPKLTHKTAKEWLKKYGKEGEQIVRVKLTLNFLTKKQFKAISDIAFGVGDQFAHRSDRFPGTVEVEVLA